MSDLLSLLSLLCKHAFIRNHGDLCDLPISDYTYAEYTREQTKLIGEAEVLVFGLHQH